MTSSDFSEENHPENFPFQHFYHINCFKTEADCQSLKDRTGSFLAAKRLGAMAERKERRRAKAKTNRAMGKGRDAKDPRP